MENKRQVGKQKEDTAAAFLESNGFIVLKKNYSSKYGEIDIIAKNNRILAFFEVKYRKTLSSGQPYESVSNNKIKKISLTAMHFLATNIEYQSFQPRFDIISILDSEINWIKNAFEFSGNTFL